MNESWSNSFYSYCMLQSREEIVVFVLMFVQINWKKTEGQESEGNSTDKGWKFAIATRCFVDTASLKLSICMIQALRETLMFVQINCN